MENKRTFLRDLEDFEKELRVPRQKLKYEKVEKFIFHYSKNAKREKKVQHSAFIRSKFSAGQFNKYLLG